MGTGTVALTKIGTGTITLSGANTYSGATTISGGTLQIGNGGATGSLSTSSAITDNANLTINRNNAVTQGTDFSSSGISGTGSFTQAGSGTTTLNAANGFSGATTVNAGTLKTTAANALGGTSGITVNNNGSLTLSANNTINDAATMTLNGNVTTSNPATKNLVVTGSEGSSTDTSATAGLGSLTLQSRSTLDFLQSTNTIVFGQTAGVAFADSGAFKLDIYNYIGDSTPTGNFDHLVFQQDMSTLTSDFEFWNGSSFIDATAVQLGASSFWEIVPLEPVPEPGTWVAAALSLLVVAYSQRRRFARAIKRAT